MGKRNYYRLNQDPWNDEIYKPKKEDKPEEVQQDMPELQRLNAEAMETEFLWEFFGGTITLENGHQYQVTGE